MVKKRRRRRRKETLRGKPMIGVTSEVVKLKPFYAEFELVCDYRYIRAILRAGGVPVIIPVNPFPRDIKSYMNHLDGLIIPGGADIHPSFYGEKTKKKVRPIYRGRTYFEMTLIREAQKRGKPVLAICYGMQLLNVMRGGTLHQDIKSEVKGARNHCSKTQPLHKVEIQPGSVLHKIFRKKTIEVHSEHHQAVKLPGKSLKITAVAEDGIPEAVEGPSNTLAVQWHPERQAKDPFQTRLFRYFMSQVREKRRQQA